jgi:AcrR family transcriptional regulator
VEETTLLADELWAQVAPETARRLIAAAVDAFARHGYHGTSTREIAKLAGMSPAGMYVHYGSKADVLYEIAKIGHTDALAAVRHAVAGQEDPAAAVAAFARASATWHAQHHTVAKIIQYELTALPRKRFDEVRRMRRTFELVLEREIRRGLATGVFVVEDVRVASIAVLSLGIDLARWYHDGVDPSPMRLGELYGNLAPKLLQ